MAGIYFNFDSTLRADSTIRHSTQNAGSRICGNYPQRLVDATCFEAKTPPSSEEEL